MNLKIEYSEHFVQESKKLSKKYKNIKKDLQKAVKQIQNDDLGVSLGHNFFKKRVANSSIPTGKSGGFRVIIYRILDKKMFLVTIYSKTQKDSLSDDEIRNLLDEYLG